MSAETEAALERLRSDPINRSRLFSDLDIALAEIERLTAEVAALKHDIENALDSLSAEACAGDTARAAGYEAGIDAAVLAIIRQENNCRVPACERPDRCGCRMEVPDRLREIADLIGDGSEPAP